MKQLAAVMLVLALGVGLSACSETHGTGSVGSSTPTQSPEAKKAAEGFHNMEALAASVKETTNEKQKDAHIEEATCISTGKQSATCHIAGKSEESEEPSEASVEVTIAEDGTTWISK